MTLHLSIMLWLPAFGGLMGAVAGRRAAGWFAFVGSLASLAYAIALVADFKTGSGLQHVTDETWIGALGVHYKIGVDGLNLFLVLLTTLSFTAAILWSVLRSEIDRPGAYFFWLGLGHSAVLGALLAQDLLLFTVFFDLMLVPFLFLTGMFGGENRIRAIIRLFIYTLVGSLLMLAAAIATAVIASGDQSISFVFSDLAQRAPGTLGHSAQNWLFLFFAAAFLIKMPAFPFHGWMPDGYLNMPLPVLAVFSGVLSKVAAYGFLKISIPFFPYAAHHYQMLLLLLALASILYGSAMAFTTTNARLVLGYSSVAQLGFIVLGIFSLQGSGQQGALLQAVNHGLVVLPAFLIIALLAARAGSEDLREMGGGAFRAPVLAALFLIVALATLAMPGSSNFAAEFLILQGIFTSKTAIAIIASIGVAMAAVYMLRLFISMMHNRERPPGTSRELTLRDGLVLVPLVLTIIAFAVYPQVALERSESSINAVTTIAQVR